MPDIDFDASPFNSARFAPLTHTLSSHPTLSMPALGALARRLARTKQCRFIDPRATQASEFDHHPAPTDGRGLDEVLGKLDQPGTWVALYNIETDEQGKSLLEEIRQDFEPLLASQQTGITNVGGFVFISTAPSVTPFHIDRENNFWLQIRGSKTISVWPANDPTIITPTSSEKFILSGDLADVRLTDSIAKQRTDFQVQAGQGLYFPCLTPHMTRCDPDPVHPDTPSVSIGIVFYTDQTRLQARALACNRLLRRLGMSPRPPRVPEPGHPASIGDQVKAVAGRTMVGAMKRLRDFKPPPGI